MFLQLLFVFNLLLSIALLVVVPDLNYADIYALKHLWVGYVIMCLLYTAGKECST